MRVLQIHNKYRHYGGEDVVADNEYKLLKENGFTINQLFFNNDKISAIKLFHNVDSFHRTLAVIDDFKPEVIHIHNIFYIASPSVLKAAKKRNIPVVMTLHNYRLLCPGALFLKDSKVCVKCKNLLIPIYGFTNKCFQDSYIKSALLASFIGVNKINKTWGSYINKFIVLTPFIKELMVNSSLGIIEDSVVVKPNSTDDLGFSIEKKEQNRYLFVGRLSKEKGLDVLIKAFNKTPEIELDIVGSGDLLDDFKSDANKNITFHGVKNKEEIKELLGKAKALVFPSIWYEGLPNTLIEAFSTGTPILASNIDNVNSIVTSGYNAELFIPNDSDDLAKKIIEFTRKNTDVYNKNARNTYLKLYTHQRNLESLKKIYKDLIVKHEKENN